MFEIIKAAPIGVRMERGLKRKVQMIAKKHNLYTLELLRQMFEYSAFRAFYIGNYLKNYSTGKNFVNVRLSNFNDYHNEEMKSEKIKGYSKNQVFNAYIVYALGNLKYESEVK